MATRNPVNSPVEVGSEHPIIYDQVFYTSKRWWSPDFWTISTGKVILAERFGSPGMMSYFPKLNEELAKEPQNPQNHKGSHERKPTPDLGTELSHISTYFWSYSPNGGLVGEIPLISGKSRLVRYLKPQGGQLRNTLTLPTGQRSTFPNSQQLLATNRNWGLEVIGTMATKSIHHSHLVFFFGLEKQKTYLAVVFFV